MYPDNAFVSPQYGSSSRLVVAEAPGASEAIEGTPLVGGSGEWYNAMLGRAGIKRDSLTIINTIQCRPPQNIYPTDSEARSYISAEDARKAVDHCYKAYVVPMLKARVWTRVDLLGDKALQLVGKKDGGVYKWRGSPIPVPDIDPEKPLAIATLHPAAIARDQAMLPVVVNDFNKSLQIPPENYKLFPMLEEVKAFTAREFAADIETPRAGHAWEKTEISMVGLSSKVGEAIVVPFRGAYVDELKRIFANAKLIVTQNGLQFDHPVLEKFGVTTSAELMDLMLLHHLRFPSLPHDLEFIASQLTSKPCWKQDKSVFELYNARDTDATWSSYKILRPLVEQVGLMDTYRLISVPLAKICYQMYKTGFKIDPGQIARVREKLLREMEGLEKSLPAEMRTHYITKRRRHDAPPGTTNPKNRPLRYIYTEEQEAVIPWRSTSKKQAYLYGKDEDWQLGLPEQIDPKKKTITTGKVALDKLKKRVGESPRVKVLPKPDRAAVEQEIQTALSALKKLNQLDETITTFCKEQMLTTARVHPHFNVHGTSTGRLSSSDPNCQNIPEASRVIYVPSKPGYKILSVDFSGIENRITAWLADDKARQKRLEDPEFSEHKYLVSLIEGIPYKDVVKEKDPDSAYSKAKHVTHGSDRAMGALKMSQMYDMDIREVKRLLAIWKNEIKETVSWQVRIGELVRQQGHLANPFGRKIWLWSSSAYTEGISFMPQSSAADVIFRVMIALCYKQIGWSEELVKKVVRIYEPLPEDVSLLLQVHDELVFEYPEYLEDELIRIINKVMLQPWAELGGMLLPISISTSPLSWGEIETYKGAA